MFASLIGLLTKFHHRQSRPKVVHKVAFRLESNITKVYLVYYLHHCIPHGGHPMRMFTGVAEESKCVLIWHMPTFIHT